VRPPKVPTELVEGSDEDPMYMDGEGAEVKGSKGKGKAASKEKEKVKTKESEVEERWEVMTSTEVCTGCLWKGSDCEVNMAAVEKWEEDATAGKPFTRTFVGAGCKSCKAQKITCTLLRTTELRGMVVEKRKEEKEAAKKKRGGGRWWGADGGGEAEAVKETEGDEGEGVDGEGDEGGGEGG
jgi:hypothetical protein